MTIKSLARIEAVLGLLIVVLELPVKILVTIVIMLSKPTFWLWDRCEHSRWKLGNWLLRQSDDAKRGNIKNKAVLRNWTCVQYYRHFRREIHRHAN